MCRIYRYKSYAQINTILLAEASLLIVRNPTPSQVSLLLIFLWHNLHSPCKEQRTCLHSLASEALGEQSRSSYNPEAASKSHLLSPQLNLLRVVFRFCVHLQSMHFTLSSCSGAQRL